MSSLVRYGKSIILQLLTIFLFKLSTAKNLCTPGSYLPLSSRNCTACPAGTYQPRSGARGCIPCAPGSISTVDGSVRCTPCETLQTSNKYRTDCICDSGYAFDYVSKKCKICPAGTVYIKSGYSPYCESCPLNTYQPNRGASNCLDCPDGFVSGPGATQCLKCLEHQAPINGSCGVCPAGSYYQKISAICVRCSPGSFSTRPGLAIDCDVCSFGTSSGYGYGSCVKCKRRTALMEDGYCRHCKGGEYYDKYSLTCIKCSPDYYTPSKRAFEECFSCGPGSYSFAGSAKCTRCKPGTSLLSSGNCGKCPSGTYLDIFDGRNCKKCAVNTFSPGGVLPECTPCREMTYALPGSRTCSFCPKNQSLIVTSGKCEMCPPGTFYAKYSGNCVQCFNGTFKATAGPGFCKACPDETQSSEDFASCIRPLS